jgi:hypothetical protein
MGLSKRLFNKRMMQANQSAGKFSAEDYQKDYELKSIGLENVLGKMHSVVGWASIPFVAGGALDMYYFPNHIEGTGFVTMELIDPDGGGPLPNDLGTYELVAFTRHEYADGEDSQTPFNLVKKEFCGFFSMIGFYSREAILNPNETCEVPKGEGEEGACFIFDVYQPDQTEFNIGDRKHHLLLCIQLHRSEVEYAMTNGGQELIRKLKQAGNYPYSDLDRIPVA